MRCKSTVVSETVSNDFWRCLILLFAPLEYEYGQYGIASNVTVADQLIAERTPSKEVLFL